VTTPDELRAIVSYLQNRVRLASDGKPAIVFDRPSETEMIAAGLDPPTTRRLLNSPWWPEMVDDILETPDFAEPEAAPTTVLSYARDVVWEYIGKRFPLEG
jgi:hypothetical protein